MGDEADQQFALAAQCQSLLRLTGALQGAVSRITAAARTMGRAIEYVDAVGRSFPPPVLRAPPHLGLPHSPLSSAEKVGRALRDRIYLTLLATLPSDANQRLARLLDRAFLWAHGETDEEGDEDEERPAQRGTPFDLVLAKPAYCRGTANHVPMCYATPALFSSDAACRSPLFRLVHRRSGVARRAPTHTSAVACGVGRAWADASPFLQRRC